MTTVPQLTQPPDRNTKSKRWVQDQGGEGRCHQTIRELSLHHKVITLRLTQRHHWKSLPRVISSRENIFSFFFNDTFPESAFIVHLQQFVDNITSFYNGALCHILHISLNGPYTYDILCQSSSLIDQGLYHCHCVLQTILRDRSLSIQF